MTNSSASELRRVIDVVCSTLSSLTQLGYALEHNDVDFANMMVVHMVTHRFDDEIRKEWNRSNNEEAVSWFDLQVFLVEQWKKAGDDKPSKRAPANDDSKGVKGGKAHVSNQPNARVLKCFKCQGQHALWDCPDFLRMNIDDRRQVVKENSLCWNCFAKNHQVTKCQSKYRCRTCNKMHHTTVHQTFSTQEAIEGGSSSAPTYAMSPTVEPFRPVTMKRMTNVAHEEQSNGFAMVAKSGGQQRQCLLSTIVIHVKGADGSLHLVRALLDSASDTNFVTYDCATRVGLKLKDACITIGGIKGISTVVKNGAKATIKSRISEYSRTLNFAVVEEVTGCLPSVDIDKSKFEIPCEYVLADSKFHEAADVDMLLHNGVFMDSLLYGKVVLDNGPILLKTKFGWIVGGEFPVTSQRSTFLSCFAGGHPKTFDGIDEQIEKFFESDNVECPEPLLTPEEKYCEKLFDETTSKDRDGKFVVRMPFKANVGALGTNLSNATRQSYAQESRRKKDDVYNKLYVDYMNDYIATGHMTEIEPKTNELAHYLPHHGVVKMSSTSTKLRPVCNASSRSESGLSLNDVLCVGPTVQSESFDILIRFREKKYVIMCDITKMYRQIWVHPSQRKFMRILWRSDMEGPLKHYQLNTVTFGTSCAPYLATRALVQLSIENKETFPVASQAILKSFYVDDGLISVNSAEEGTTLCDQLRYIFCAAGMLLCKFSSNNDEVLKGIPDHLLDAVKDNETNIHKALGVGFDSKEDQFFYRLKAATTVQSTKASVLSEIASVYDPIGWIGPVILTAKLFMKSLWLMDLGWSDVLPPDVQESWNEFRVLLPSVNEVRIPRQCIISNYVTAELHGFSDASIAAYGAVFYILSYDQVGNSQVSIICAKSRVAPKNQKTLARLELCAATLLAKLGERIIKIFDTKVDQVVLWSDSTIVIHWISMIPSRLSTYVGNRVAVIQELTHRYVWKHIKGTDNPADVISRGLAPNEIAGCNLWWNGPEFFKQPKSEWPESIIEVTEDDPEVCKEVKRCLVVKKTVNLIDLVENRFSRYERIINCFATIKRFSNNSCATKTKRSGPFSIDEKDDAEMTIVRIVQQNFFPVEVSTLLKVKELSTNGQPNPVEEAKLQGVMRKSPLLQLSPFLDEHNVLRVGGRLDQGQALSYDQKHQILLPNCKFTEALVRWMHEKHEHVGKLSLLSFLKQRYWIVKAKTVVNKVLRLCLRCFRANPIDVQQLMGNLPRARVTPSSAFSSTAVDYTGFYYMKASILSRNPTTVKVYIVVFKCMATGAIHLELVTDLTTEAFIAAFERFICRRGLCKEMYSDNGTCFVGADNDLKKIVDTASTQGAEFLIRNSIRWQFTTPRAPHAGGIYESGVKSMKYHLKRILEGKLYTIEQFWTILHKVEAILNSRPLTPLSDDPNDFRVLTPGHFLIGRPLISMPQRDFTEIAISRLNRWQGLQKLQREFWNKWSSDYLSQLQTRPKGFREMHTFAVGDFVLVKETALPPMKWLKGRIIKVFPDNTGVVRNVEVHTMRGKKQRNVKYLCLLPMDETVEAGECVPEGTNAVSGSNHV